MNIYVCIYVYMNVYVNDTLIGLPQIDHSTVPLKDTFQSGKYVYVHILLCIYVCIYEYICK
jgi:hypothetical protein